MPMAAAAISAAFSYVSAAAASAAYSAATAIGISSATAGTIGAAVSSSIMWVGTANGFGTLMAVGSVVSSLSQKVPQPAGAVVQLDTKLSATPPRTVAFGRTALAGTMLYQAVSGVKKPDDNIRLHRIIGLSVGPIDSIESFHIGDKELTFGPDGLYGLGEVTSVSGTAPDSKLWRTNYRQGYSLGQTPEPAAPPTYTGTAMPGLSAASKLSGIAHITQHLDFHAENFPTGDPKNGGYRIVGKWAKLYDPRKDSTYLGGLGSHRLDDPDTFEWGENPIIMALNFALGHFQNGKLVWGMGAPRETIDIAAFVAAANVADVNGWKAAGEFSTVDDKFSVLSTILASASAKPVNHSGHLSVFIDAPMASVLTLTKADVVGSVELSTSTAWRDRRNRAIAFSRSEANGWEMVGGEPIAPSTYLAEDGEQKTLEINYPYVQDPVQANQLGAYELTNTREFLNFTVTCTPRLSMAARPGDCITLDLPDIAAANRKCVVMAADIDPATWQITLTLRSETDGKHAFALGQTTEAPSSPSLSGSYDPSNPYTPTDAFGFPSWTIIGNSVSKDGVVMPAVVIGGQVDDDNCREVIVDYREFSADEDDWTNWTTASRNTKRFEIAPLKSAQAYYVSVQHRNGFGALSKRLILGPATTADLKIDAGKIDFLEALGTASLAEFNEFVQETNDLATQASADASAAIAAADLFEGRLDAADAATLAESEARVDGDTSLANTLALIGAKNGPGTAFVLDNTKVEITPGQSLASKMNALQSASDTNSASITSLSTTVTNNQSSTASSLATLTATTNSHTSSISTLSGASSTYGARWGVTLNSNGHMSGLLMNNGGASKSNITMVADSVVIASTSGGVQVAPFAVSGSTVYMDNVVARNIGANTITTAKIVANNIATTTVFLSMSSLTLASYEQSLLSGAVAIQGKVEVHVFVNFSQSSGSPAGAAVTVYRNGSPLAGYGVYCIGAWGSNSAMWVIPDTPGAGTHTYDVRANTTSGSSGNPTKTMVRIQINDKKTEA